MIKRILFILVLCLLVLTPVVSATTITGSLTGTNYSQSSYANGGFGASSKLFQQWYVNSIEYNANLKSFIIFDNYQINSYDAGSSAGETTSFTLRTTSLNGPIIATGTMGYQRLYNTAVPPVEQFGYVWFVFDNGWNVTGLSGDRTDIWCNYSASAMRNVTRNGMATTRLPPSDGNIEIYGNPAATYLQTYEVQMDTDYIAVAPMGLGISGNATKASGTTSRVYIINPISGATITSEGTQTSTLYNFNIDNNAGTGIKIAAQDSKGNFYNTSTLFAGAGLPTPTPTPTPIPTTIPPGGPGSESNITIAVKGISNDSAIAGAYVEMQYYLKAANHNDPNGWQSSLQGYTAATTGYFQADFVDITNYDIKVVVQKAGYQKSEEWITPSPYYYSRIIWLYLDTTGQGIPPTINMTLQVKNSVSGANIANAVVTARDTIAGTSPRSAVTNATGYAVFKTFPNTANIDGTITATNYQTRSWSIEVDPETGTYLQSKDYSKVLYMASIGVPTGTQTPFPTPTPTPVSQDILSLSATPDSVSVGDNVTLVGSSSNATKLTYAGGLRQTLFYMNKNNPNLPFNNELIGIFYNVNATHWKFKTDHNAVFGTPSTASPLTMIHAPQTNALYTYRFAAFDVNTRAIGQAASRNVLVGGGAGAGSLVMNLYAADGRTTGHLMNFQLNITDDASGVVTEFGNISYDKDMSLLRGNSYTLQASKSNYKSGSQQFTVPIDPRIIEGDYGAMARVKLYPEGWITVGNCSVSVHVNDAETYYPISSVQISIPGYPIQYTGEDGGSASFSIPENTAYTVTASKQGYCSVSESKNTSTDTYQYVSMMMKYGACIGVTPTHTPIPGLTPTPSPVPTPIGGVYNGTAAVCGALPENPTLMDVLRNSFACNGIVDLVMQNMALSMLIMLIGAIILGRVASGIGVLAGAIIGAVVSTAMGLLPFWIIIVLIIIAGLVFAGKIFWSNQ